jgi:hypothetical protein
LFILTASGLLLLPAPILDRLSVIP